MYLNSSAVKILTTASLDFLHIGSDRITFIFSMPVVLVLSYLTVKSKPSGDFLIIDCCRNSVIPSFCALGNFRNPVSRWRVILDKLSVVSKKSDLFYRIRRLIDEKQMGELFKVMLIKKKKNKFKTGFEID